MIFCSVYLLLNELDPAEFWFTQLIGEMLLFYLFSLLARIVNVILGGWGFLFIYEYSFLIIFGYFISALEIMYLIRLLLQCVKPVHRH